jgi:hypothetical protein
MDGPNNEAFMNLIAAISMTQSMKLKILQLTRWPAAERWYVGITDDPFQRIAVFHQVRPIDTVVLELARNAEIARIVERALIDELHADGGSGGGDASSCYVYAYPIQPHTKQR